MKGPEYTHKITVQYPHYLNSYSTIMMEKLAQTGASGC
jgi:hypothetical protein